MNKSGFQLKVGSVFETSGVKHFVSQINHAINQVILTSVQSEDPVVTTIDRLYDGVKRGEVVALNIHGETADASLQVLHDDTLSGLSKREYALRKEVVEFVNKAVGGGCPVTVAYGLAATEFSKPSESSKKRCSQATQRKAIQARHAQVLNERSLSKEALENFTAKQLRDEIFRKTGFPRFLKGRLR
ncbi:hypothetical protein [Limnobacter sp.]|uniref:hypothetical protein n=1 Tax=Limnobacter sp. TaxID=2003368 RepID=UPI0025877AD3|nr:hypothetical protein [Limnobacter sp.]